MLKHNGQRLPNLPQSARSLVATLASPLPLVFQRFHLMVRLAWPRSLALSAFLCPQLHRRPPTARSEGFVSASAQQDRMMKTLAPDVPPVLVAEAQCRALRSVQLPLRLDLHSLSSASQCLFQSHWTGLLCGPKATQPLQPGVAPCLATTLVVKYTRRCPEGPWSCCVTIVAFKFSALPFQESPRTFFNSLVTNLSSSGTRWNDVAFRTPFPVRMMCSSVIGALPTQIP